MEAVLYHLRINTLRAALWYEHQKPFILLIFLAAFSVGMLKLSESPRPYKEFNKPQFKKKEIQYLIDPPKIFIQWRETFLTTITQTDDRGLVSGIFLGEISRIPAPIRSEFNEAGLYHLLSANGFNCWIVAMIFSFVGRLLLHGLWFRIPSRHGLLLRKRIGPACALLGAWLFFFWSTQSPAIVRATVMVNLKYALEIADIRARFHRLLLAYYLISLTLAPRLWNNPSFQMTFGCLFGMLLMRWIFKSLHVPKSAFTEYLSATLGASLGALPTTWLFFGELNLTSLFTNFYAVPITSFFIMPFGLASILTAPFSSTLCIWSVKAAVLAANGLAALVHLFLQTGISLRYVD